MGDFSCRITEPKTRKFIYRIYKKGKDATQDGRTE